ncbi:MAG: ammonium transporter [Bacillus sp. (in: firmicutes)]
MDAMVLMNSLWTMVAAILVIFMIGGFIMLEAGSTRMKNAGHIAGKTIFTFGLAVLVFWAAGYAFIFGDNGNFFVGMTGFFYDGGLVDGDGLAQTVFFVFQTAFAGIAVTIALGGFAERAKFPVYIIFTILFGLIVYPVVAHWIWGGGWLSGHGKQDFAGSTVVHLTGAMGALAATLLLKPRIGKYNRDGSVNNLAGHNQVYTALGVLILWVGWFGFNAGSTVSVDGAFFGYVALNTNLAAAAGAVAATIISWLLLGKSDIPTILNGALAGLVAITASCAFVAPWASVVIGLVAGILVHFSMKFFEKLRVDDPIFALSVHGAAGVWGTLSTGFFATPELAEQWGGQAGLFYGGGFGQLGVQAMGVAASGAFAFVVSFIILYVIKLVLGGLRVSEEEEIMGLDMSEHGSYGYPEQMAAENDMKKSV